MNPLSAQDILQVWERGQNQHPVVRALTLLSAACSEMTRNDMAALSIGQRDALLLTLREQIFGSKLNGFAECPQCFESIEFTVDVDNIRVNRCSDIVAHERELSMEGFYVRFRLLNSLDLASIINCKDIAMARSLLVQGCVLQASRDDVTISPTELSKEVTERLIMRLAECDPQAEVLLNLECPACAHCWQMIFDISSFFWTEISAQAKRLLREVHTLAQAYGWREADILSMSAARRQFYLEMVS